VFVYANRDRSAVRCQDKVRLLAKPFWIHRTETLQLSLCDDEGFSSSSLELQPFVCIGLLDDLFSIIVGFLTILLFYGDGVISPMSQMKRV
jgi:hypothetical protein